MINVENSQKCFFILLLTQRYEKRDMQVKVRNNFKELMSPAWHVIDADNTVEALAMQIEELSLQHIKTVSSKPIDLLWVEDGDAKSE